MAKINYNGMELELEEVYEPQIFDPPKKMVVWNYNEGHPVDVRELPVIAILPRLQTHLNILCKDGELEWWASSCAEIPEEPKPRRATNRELAKWLAQGKGEYTNTKAKYYDNYSSFSYKECNKDVDVYMNFKIRKWDDVEWHEPDVQYMGIEE